MNDSAGNSQQHFNTPTDLLTETPLDKYSEGSQSRNISLPASISSAGI
jgi:hypothetical protein